MILLGCKDLCKSYGVDAVLDKVTFQIALNDKVGFIGANGAGKSTLFKILADKISYDSGKIYKAKDVTIGYMAQNTSLDSDKVIMEEMKEVFSKIINLENEIKVIEKKMEKEKEEEVLLSLSHEHNSLMERIKEEEGFGYENRIKGILKGLGFSEEDLIKEINMLSGGEKTRVELAKILLQNPQVLLLDEPTNHLDIQAVEWLENYLSSFTGSLIVISHDRYFLDKVTNKTMELMNNKLKIFNGNYTTFIKKRNKEQEIQIKKYKNDLKEIKRMEGIIEQQRQWNRERNIKAAESKLKALDKFKENVIAPEKEVQNIYFQIQSGKRSGKEVLKVEELSKSYKDQHLFSDITFDLTLGDKVFLLGANGTGKSTLLKILNQYEAQDNGSYKYGSNVEKAYFDQEQAHIDYNKEIIEEIWDEYPDLTETEIRNSLAAFNFKGDDVYKKISTLSGGEKVRVVLLRTILAKANFLILDEPTNHLDIGTREVLENALIEYDGTMLLVSHDRYFINKLANRILELENNDIVEYLGDYDYYKSKKAKNTKQTKNNNEELNIGKQNYQEQKQKRALEQKRLREFEEVETLILQWEERVNILEEELCTQEVAVDYKKSMEITQEIKEIKEKLNCAYIKWEELSDKI